MNPLERKRAEECIREVAQRNGVSVAEVRREINLTIADAYKRAKKRDDPAWAVWTRQPTPEEFILWVNRKIAELQ